MEDNTSQITFWPEVGNIDEIPSPALLVYPDRIENNIRKMIDIAGSPGRLRPHVKTHKMAEVIKLQMKYGISKFKCATIAEAELLARCQAPDIMLALQPVGPNIERFFNLRHNYGNLNISCIADNEDIIIQISDMARKTGLETHVWLDINNGMNRTGVIPGEKAIRLFKRIVDSPMLVAEGLHVYDGHIHNEEFSKRKTICDEAFSSVTDLIDNMKHEGIFPVKVVAGGTPTFPVHAMRENVELSPGTCLLWDWGYSSSFSDLKFEQAAVLVTRVVSKPAKEMLCLDLGHKAVSSEMPHPRIKITGHEKYSFVSHSEEHIVIRTKEADNFKPGDVLYCIPQHICPTVDRHDQAYVVRNNHVEGKWMVEARKRIITY